MERQEVEIEAGRPAWRKRVRTGDGAPRLSCISR